MKSEQYLYETVGTSDNIRLIRRRRILFTFEDSKKKSPKYAFYGTYFDKYIHIKIDN